MGKTPKPLRIFILDKDLYETLEVQEYKAKGHFIDYAGQYVAPRWPIEENDLVMGKKAWRMDLDLMKYLPLALAEGRRVKYPKATKEGD